MELIRKPIHYTKEGKRIFDQFYLDEDYNVPDAKDDVQRIVMGNARVKTEEIRLVENYVRITGKVYFQILYVTATGDPKPAVLEGKLPFEEMVYTEGGEDETWFIQNVRTEFTASVVHSRKLSLRVMVEMEIGRERLEDEETTVDIESDVPVYRKRKKIDLLKLAVSLRGELLVFCMYLSEEEKADWIAQSVPYEGRISCDGVSEEMYYYVHHALDDTLVDIRMDEDGEMRVLGIEGTLNLRMNIYEEEEMEILEDLYSLEQNCSFTTRSAVYEELLMQNQSKCKVSERLTLPELKEDVLQIIYSRGSIQVEHTEETDEVPPCGVPGYARKCPEQHGVPCGAAHGEPGRR